MFSDFFKLRLPYFDICVYFFQLKIHYNTDIHPYECEIKLPGHMMQWGESY